MKQIKLKNGQTIDLDDPDMPPCLIKDGWLWVYTPTFNGATYMRYGELEDKQ